MPQRRAHRLAQLPERLEAHPGHDAEQHRAEHVHGHGVGRGVVVGRGHGGTEREHERRRQLPDDERLHLAARTGGPRIERGGPAVAAQGRVPPLRLPVQPGDARVRADVLRVQGQGTLVRRAGLAAAAEPFVDRTAGRVRGHQFRREFAGPLGRPEGGGRIDLEQAAGQLLVTGPLARGERHRRAGRRDRLRRVSGAVQREGEHPEGGGRLRRGGRPRPGRGDRRVVLAECGQAHRPQPQRPGMRGLRRQHPVQRGQGLAVAGEPAQLVGAHQVLMRRRSRPHSRRFFFMYASSSS